jgi:hypothetical protein
MMCAVETDEVLEPVYDRLGYLPIARFTLWAGHRGHE